MKLRSADATTLFRTAMVFLIIYLLFTKFNPWVTILLIVIMFALDAIDGFFAVHEASRGKIGFAMYLRSALGDKKAKELVRSYKKGIGKNVWFGPRMDIAGDRVIEYTFWIAFTYLRIVPLFVLLIIVIRHSFADAFMGARGTSSKMKTRFAEVVYASSIGRGGINIVKILTFSYLVLVYVASYPIIIGYILVTILVAYIVLRGIAEIYEALKQ